MSNSCNPSFIEIELIPAARDPGIGIIPWCPLAGGMLSGNDKKGERRGPVEKLEAYAKLCAELGRTEADVTIAWLLRNPGVTSVVIGPNSVARLEQMVHVAELQLPDDFCSKLDEFFPGYETGPEAYAW